jgi:PIN domain nuclease of toxin-antitoxin system
MIGGGGGSLVVDTHSVIWYLQVDRRLSRAAETSMDGALAEGHAIHVPSICLVEMVYLIEKGRIPAVASDRVDEVVRDPDSGFQLAPLDLRVAEAIRRVARSEVPDMPDRILAARVLGCGAAAVCEGPPNER